LPRADFALALRHRNCCANAGALAIEV